RVRLGAAGRARGVDFIDSDGSAGHIDAALVILAAASVQNARLLLASAQKAAPRGVGNSHGLVGQHFVCHNVVSVYGLFDEHTASYLGVNAGSLICQDGYRKDAHPPPAFGSYQWGIAPSIKPNDLLGIAQTRTDLWGRALHEFMHKASAHLGSMSALCETLPNATNRIELADQKDSHGIPLARIV